MIAVMKTAVMVTLTRIVTIIMKIWNNLCMILFLYRACTWTNTGTEYSKKFLLPCLSSTDDFSWHAHNADSFSASTVSQCTSHCKMYDKKTE
jgi:hypothetical protein